LHCLLEGKFRLKIKAGRACPAAFIVYFPETKKTTGAPLEPARGFCSSIDSCSSTDFTPARQAKKAAIPKVKICKQPTRIIHPNATLEDDSWSYLVAKTPTESKQRIRCCFFLDMNRAFRYKTFSAPR
jgi:hypothetical protein